ncbi:MAG: DNA topoisomerase III [Gammaproteobacteria bacterium]|nr:MAG: DNA topoisomerase III [Gammaproteobacteria bacterium]
MRLVICEKPSQARDLSVVLGRVRSGDGFIETTQGTLTWVIGHLLETAPPERYDAVYKQWRWEHLPIVPTQWLLEPKDGKKKQLGVIRKLLKQAREVVIATDAGREGELIARETLSYLGYRGPAKRLWSSSLDAASLQRAWDNLFDAREKNGLHWAAQVRQRSDWLVGMNLSRAASIALAPRGVVLSVGRVQTPTLAMVVRRDLEIEDFQPRTYFEVAAEVETPRGNVIMRYAPKDEEKRLWTQEDADKVLSRVQGAQGPIRAKTERKRQAPPLPYSLNVLQQECSRKYSLSLKETLDIAQKLYEAKLITYPRTDCRTLPEAQQKEAAFILGALSKSGVTPKEIQPRFFRKQVFNTTKTNEHDHHAIIPTGEPPTGLAGLDEKVYRMIARRYAIQFLPDHEYDATRLMLDANGIWLIATGRVTVAPGWKSLFSQNGEAENDEDKQKESRLPPVQDGDPGTVRHAKAETKQTKPPKPYTEGTLVADMVNVRKYVDDPRLKKILKDTSGIGEESSRPGILETLKKRGYLEVRKSGKTKQIRSTELGRRFIEAIPAPLKNPGVTAVWEDLLNDIAVGKRKPDEALKQVVNYVRKQIDLIGKIAPDTMKDMGRKDTQPEEAPPIGPPDCPKCGKTMSWRKGRYGHFWGCSGYPGCKVVLQPDGTRKTKATPPEDAPECPKCGAPMLPRKGGRSGKFWGCSKFPKCKGTREIEEVPS